uniref:G-protein coupled receptors family 3 profile domain-containing protein n=1 Tax=Gadus morhua TaxID=8049 RepID=A0A8C5C9P6_GADMO
MLSTQRWSEQGLALLQLLLVASFSKSEEQVCSLMGEPEEPQLFKTGDVILGGIFSFQSNWKTVDLNFRAFQYAQAMLFAIEEINNSSDLLPGITLGYMMYDTCGSIARSVRVALALTDVNEETASLSDNPCRGSVPAIIGEASSSPCMAISTVLGPFYIPLVSHFATCACLSNKVRYPSFLRTIPSDYYQSRALAQMVKHFGWTWVGAIRSSDDYGTNGMATFTDTATQLGICLEYSVSFFRTDPSEKIQRIINIIKGSTSRVIVTFLSYTDLEILIDEFAHHNLTGYQWVGTEAWISDSVTATTEGHYILDGSVGLAIPKAEVSGLREFMLDVKPLNSSGEKLFTHQKECTGYEDLAGLENSFNDMSLMPIFNNVYKGVYAIAHSLHNILGCGQKKYMINNKSSIYFQILQNIKNIHFKTKEGEEVYFNENGDPAAKYDIINWQPKKDGSVEFVTIGLYDASLPEDKQLNLDNKTFNWANNSKKVPVSICSGTCDSGTRKVLQKGKPVCCYDCIPCAEGEVADYHQLNIHPSLYKGGGKGYGVLYLAVMSTVAFIFFRHRNTPIVKANNSELSFLLLFSLTLCFLCSLTFIGRPSDWSCMLRHTAFGITFVLCISCVLGKTLAVLMAFKATLPGSNLMKWFGPRRQRIVVLAFTFIQIGICIVWLTANPPYPFKNLRHFKDKIILECALGSPIGFWAVLGYIGLLALLCFILAFLARKLPDNFNEAKFITFSMLIFCAVWMTFIPAYVSSPGKFSVVVEIFAILASSFGLLFCIFFPKCYIILLKPEKNTKKNMMDKKS